MTGRKNGKGKRQGKERDKGRSGKEGRKEGRQMKGLKIWRNVKKKKGKGEDIERKEKAKD